MCYSDVIFSRLRQFLVLFTHADCDRRLLRRMALRNKFLSPTCPPGLGDVDTYFFFEKIFRSEIRMCVEVTSFFEQLRHYNTHSDLRSKYFFKKKVCVDIS